MRVLRVRSMSEFFPGFFMAANLFNYVVAREEGAIPISLYPALASGEAGGIRVGRTNRHIRRPQLLAGACRQISDGTAAARSGSNKLKPWARQLRLSKTSG